jgi:hypothetical protein
MALVRRLTHKELEKTGIHSEAECTYSVVDGQVTEMGNNPVASARRVLSVQSWQFSKSKMEFRFKCWDPVC